MNQVSNFAVAKDNQRLQYINNQVKDLKSDALEEFRAFNAKQIILGDWNDSLWKYQNKNLYFTKPIDNEGNKVGQKTKPEDKEPLDLLFSDIIKLYTLIQIKRGKIAKSISADIIANSWLFESIFHQESKLLSFKQSTLDDAIPLLEKHFTKRGPFERYKEMVRFTKTFLVPNNLVLSFAPKVKMPNPAVAQSDVTTKEYQNRKEEKYDAEIDKYLGIVKQRFDEDVIRIKANKPAIYPEPNSGYDELRLLAIPFLMAFGLRVGELCRLTKDCLQYDETNERWYLNVLTEKGELPAARPVPRVWQDIIFESHRRIIEMTEAYRLSAIQVENIGAQAFINALSFDDRPEHIKQALLDNGYDPSLYFLRSEIGKGGDIHRSGLSYNICRHSYSSAEVGKIRCSLNIDGKKQLQLVLSKEIISELASEKYTKCLQDVYNENAMEEGEQGSYSSDSFQQEIPFSEHLFIVKDEIFTAVSNTAGFIPKPLTPREFGRWITADTSKSITVFQRYGITDGEGEPVSFCSHQFRHWLTTALMRSGKNEMMIDLFMGRKAGQSRHYDHRSAKERAEAIREKYMGDNVPDDALGRRILRMRENNVSLDEIETALSHTLSVVHFTPWGTCNRDLDVSPCEKGMMCLRDEEGKGCQHFGIDTSDLKAKQSIINTKAHYENQLSALLPNYQELNEKLNNQQPLDQHIQYCIDTINGCENALKAYEKSETHEDNSINIVNIFEPGVTKDGE